MYNVLFKLQMVLTALSGFVCSVMMCTLWVSNADITPVDFDFHLGNIENTWLRYTDKLLELKLLTIHRIKDLTHALFTLNAMFPLHKCNNKV